MHSSPIIHPCLFLSTTRPPPLYSTRELPGIALVIISTGQIFMGKGNTLNYIDILKYCSSKELIHLCQKTVKWHRVLNCSFKLCTERALKAICFSLQFYYLEVLDQIRTPSGRSARTYSFHQGVIC